MRATEAAVRLGLTCERVWAPSYVVAVLRDLSRVTGAGRKARSRWRRERNVAIDVVAGVAAAEEEESESESSSAQEEGEGERAATVRALVFVSAVWRGRWAKALTGALAVG